MTSAFTKTLAAQPSGFDFVKAHFDCEENRYSAANPNGFVNFGSAQNYLHGSELESFLPNVSFLHTDSHYRPFGGTEDCRQAVAAYLSDLTRDSQNSVDVDPNEILVGNGLISVLEALGRALLDDGDKVLVPTPVFPGLVNALTLRLQSGIEFLPTGPDDGFRISPQAIESSLRKHAEGGNRIKAVLICSPGNPVGQVLSLAELREIHRIAKSFDCPLIVDEIYASSCFDGVNFTSAIELQEQDVFILGGLSKDFGLAGFATAWLLCPDEDVR